MTELSVIIPFVNEFPQVIFTIQNIAQELLGRVDFEIIAIDNYCGQFKVQVENQNKVLGEKIVNAVDPIEAYNLMDKYRGPSPDKGGESVQACERLNPWLKYLKWEKSLSHWQAKRIGVEASEGKYLWFCDSHCIVTRNGLYDMLQYYKESHDQINGSIHLPLTYKILESRRLIYKPVFNLDKYEVDYRFTPEAGSPFRDKVKPYKVPCMSCCGVMMSREVYNKVGGWPLELGIYGGGEHFLNFTLAVLGMNKWIHPYGTLFHHGDNRSYHYIYDDYIRNKIIAAYLYGGKEFAHGFSKRTKGRPEVLENMYQDVVKKCEPHRNHIKQNQEFTIQEWCQKWVPN